MSDVGKPHDYDENRYQTHGPTTKVERPLGGFMEERIAKLESDANDTHMNIAQITSTLAVAEHAIDGTFTATCQACEGPISPIKGTIVFPLCEDCMENLGRITKSRKSWWFKP